MTPKEAQLAEIRQRVRMWREDAAECGKRADAARKSADAHDADAAHAEQMARRWEVVHDAIRFGCVPNLDGCKGPETDEVPF